MPHIRFWVYDDILASGVSGPIDVLTAANTLWSRAHPSGRRDLQPLFAWRIESLDGKPVRTASGQILKVDGAINTRTSAQAIFLTAPFLNDIARFIQEHRRPLTQLLAGLRRQHERGALLATYCTGSFLFAEAGLLNGRIATTHWSKAQEFAKCYPGIDLRTAEVLTDQDGVICGGAVTSYLKLALKLVERHAGEELAAKTSRHLLIDANRVSQAACAFADAEGDAMHSDRLVSRAQQ
jgi:transcriptional regulator GlxA family with amidase domain